MSRCGFADYIDGGAGVDTVSYVDAGAVFRFNSAVRAGASPTMALASVDTLVSIENVFGSMYNDDITGDQFNNTIWGAGGNDRLPGDAAQRHVAGGVGNDVLKAARALTFSTCGDGIDTASYLACAPTRRCDGSDLGHGKTGSR